MKRAKGYLARRVRLALTVGAIAAVFAMVGTNAMAGTTGVTSKSAPGVSKGQIVIGMVTELTGPFAFLFDGSEQGAQARIDLQNAQGGVNGRKLKLLVRDGESNPVAATTATDSLESNTLALLLIGGLAASVPSPSQGDYPILVGPPSFSFDSNPEFTNVVPLAATSASYDPGSGCDPYNLVNKELESLGAKRVAYIAGAGACGDAISYQAHTAGGFGLTAAYVNESVPSGTSNVSSIVLAMKAARVDSVYMAESDNTDFAIMETAKQDGLHLKVAMDLTAYTQQLLDDPSAEQAAQGIVVAIQQVPVEAHTAATKIEQAAFTKYEHFSGAPSLNWTFGWAGADLLIQALKTAGSNPTRAGILKAIHNLKNYNVGGLYPVPLALSTSAIGKQPRTYCQFFVQFRGKSFHPLDNAKPVCGAYNGPKS